MTPAPQPGVLRLEPFSTSGVSDADAYILRGEAASAPVEKIEFAEGVALPPRRHFTPGQPFRLKILHFNDLHGHICRFTRHGEVPLFANMVSRMKALRQQARHRDDMGVLVISAGDDLIGSIFDELLTGTPESGPIHVSYHLFSAAGVDAAALGNHDLDVGPDLLAQAIARDARFPILSANLSDAPHLQAQVSPAALFVLKGVRVGVIGLSTPGELSEKWRGRFQMRHPVQAARNILPALRPLCDVVIILSHLGFSINSQGAVMRDAGDVELARSLPHGGVHLIVGGHTHHILNAGGLLSRNVVNGIPIAQAGSLGEFLGEVDITIRQAPAVTNARLTRTALLPTDVSFRQEHIVAVEKMAKPLLSRPLGRTANSQDLDTDCVRNDLAAGESALANFIADALVDRCRQQGRHVDLAFVDASSIRTGIPVGGALTYGDWFNVMPFADTIHLCQLTGRQLFDLVQDNARRVDLPGAPHVERGFLHFSRPLRYVIELHEDRAQIRARDITFAGKPLQQRLDDVFVAACASFVREPARTWEAEAARTGRLDLFSLHQAPHRDTGLFLRQELITYILEHGGVTAQAGARRDGRLVIQDDAILTSHPKHSTLQVNK